MSLKNNRNISDKDILGLLRFARAYSAEKLAWFSPALFKCKIHLTEHVEVAAIDYSFNIYFNPRAIAIINRSGTKIEVLAQVGFLWIHEISHVLREHGERAKERNAEAFLWNVAADLEINDSTWEGMNMPNDFQGLLPHKFRLPTGQIAEFYYKKLLEQGGNSPFLKNYHMDEGSGVHGQARPWEIGGERLEKQELNALELELVRRSVAHEMKEAKAMSIGTIPGNWMRWAEEKLRPKVDWRKVLRHRMSVAINNGLGNRIDYSFRRPSRRQSVYHPIITPNLSGDLSARVAVVVDTSGSMSKEQIGQAVAEVCKVLETFQVPVTVIPCDAKAYEPITIATTSDYVKLRQLKGGGGTNMIVGIEAALKLRPKPDSILVMTDGYTPYPQKKYKTSVLFGLLKLNNQDVPKPPMPPWTADTIVEIDIAF